MRRRMRGLEDRAKGIGPWKNFYERRAAWHASVVRMNTQRSGRHIESRHASLTEPPSLLIICSTRHPELLCAVPASQAAPVVPKNTYAHAFTTRSVRP